MLKRIKTINSDTKQVLTMSEKSNQAWAVENGYSADLHEVKQGCDGNYYLSGFEPQPPKQTYIDQRIAEYPTLDEQLDMIYHDFDNWKSVIKNIKDKYPKV